MLTVRKTNPRHTLLGLCHKAAKMIGMDEPERIAFQMRTIGVESLKDASNEHLRVLLWHFRKLGANIGVPLPPLLGGEGDIWDPRPTRNQLGLIEKLAVDLGWNDGLNDERLTKFCKHTCKVDALLFLDRERATHLINGLQKMAANSR